MWLFFSSWNKQTLFASKLFLSGDFSIKIPKYFALWYNRILDSFCLCIEFAWWNISIFCSVATCAFAYYFGEKFAVCLLPLPYSMHKIFACLSTNFYLFISFFRLPLHFLLPFHCSEEALRILCVCVCVHGCCLSKSHNDPNGATKTNDMNERTNECKNERIKSNKLHCIFLMTVTWYHPIDVRLHWFRLARQLNKNRTIFLFYILLLLYFFFLVSFCMWVYSVFFSYFSIE